MTPSDILLTVEQALAQNPENTCPVEIIGSLALIEVIYIGYDDNSHTGQIVISKDVKADVTSFFELALKLKFPFKEVIPAAKYGWDDNVLMANNVTSGFNYRLIAGEDQLSEHAYGRAFDVNTVQNPYIRLEGDKKITIPDGATWDKKVPGTLYAEHPLVKLMKEHGWVWGGDWTLEANSVIDYQHFEKP